MTSRDKARKRNFMWRCCVQFFFFFSLASGEQKYEDLFGFAINHLKESRLTSKYSEHSGRKPPTCFRFLKKDEGSSEERIDFWVLGWRNTWRAEGKRHSQTNFRGCNFGVFSDARAIIICTIAFWLYFRSHGFLGTVTRSISKWRCLSPWYDHALYRTSIIISRVVFSCNLAVLIYLLRYSLVTKGEKWARTIRFQFQLEVNLGLTCFSATV